jgi:YggT family protein
MALALVVIQWILTIFLICLFVRVLLSYFPISYGTPMASVQRVVVGITDPVLAPVRRILPPVTLGGGGALDLSPIVVFFIILILRQVI